MSDLKDGSRVSEPHGSGRAKCTATAKTTGKPCERWPEPGAKTCYFHGSATKKSHAKAARNVAEAKAREQMARLGLPEPVEISAAEAMIWSVSAKFGEVCWLRAMVASVPQQDLVWGVARERAGKPPSSPVDGVEPIPGTGQPPDLVAAPERTFEARANIWWVMLRGAEDQLVRYAKDARAAGCDEARVRLAEAQGDMLASFVKGLLTALYGALLAAGVTGADFEVVWATSVAELVPKHFRALGPVARVETIEGDV